MTRAEAEEWAEENDVPLLFADGFDKAIVGIVERCGQKPFVVYSREKCLKILMRRDKCSWGEADEHFEFNVAGAWVGDHTPGFI